MEVGLSRVEWEVVGNERVVTGRWRGVGTLLRLNSLVPSTVIEIFSTQEVDDKWLCTFCNVLYGICSEPITLRIIKLFLCGR